MIHDWRELPTHGGPIDCACSRCGARWEEADPEPAGPCAGKTHVTKKPLPAMDAAKIKQEARRLADSGSATEEDVRRLAYLVALLAEITA